VCGGFGTNDGVFARHCATKDCQGMPGRVESQQGRQSGQRRYRKGLRSSMPRRRCTCSNYCGPDTLAGSCPCSDGSGSGTKDCQGMSGRVESQQGRQSGQRRYGKGLRSSMPRRRCTCSNHCGSDTSAGSCPCSDGSTGSPVQARSTTAPDR